MANDEGQLPMVLASEVDNKGLALFLRRRVYSSSSDDVANADPSLVINEKIKHAFSNVSSLPLNAIIIQFWAPVKDTSERLLLSTCGQPFAVGRLNHRVCKYRSFCTKYTYSIINHDDDDVSEERDEIISDSLVANAFKKHFPEVVVDLRGRKGAGKGNLLVDKALDCDLNCCFTVPVLYPDPAVSESSSYVCVGVVECCMMRRSDLLVIFNELKRALEGVGLSIYHVQEEESSLYKTISCLKPPISEIEEALELVCESHDVTIGQVWIPHESVSVRMENRQTQQVLVKLVGYRADSDSNSDEDEDPFIHMKYFYDNCNVLPLKKGNGIAERALETYEAHFCRNIHKLSGDDNGLLPAVLSADIRCSCFVICLRSIHTGNVDYVFEFLWHKNRNYLIVLESLLLKLSKCLSSFKLVSGAQLGDKLRVIDVENSTGRGIGSFHVLLKQEQETTTIAGGKRKFSDLNHHQQDIEDVQEEDEDVDDDDDYDDEDRVIVVLYKETVTLFHVTAVFTNLEHVKEKINQDFELDPGTCYSLEYQVDDGIWLTVHDDQEFTTCILLSRSTNKTHIKLRCSSS